MNAAVEMAFEVPDTVVCWRRFSALTSRNCESYVESVIIEM